MTYTRKCLGIVNRCQVCEKLKPITEVTAIQKWEDGELKQVFKCHECLEKERGTGK